MTLSITVGAIDENKKFAKIKCYINTTHLCDLDFNFKAIRKLYHHYSNPISLDFLFFTSIIYVVDKAISRYKTKDRWTRDLHLTMPVSQPELWTELKLQLESCLAFLTGDNWHFNFTLLENDLCPPGEHHGEDSQEHMSYDAVSLFSGGLDSLIGVIDYLETNPEKTLLLAGHYDAHVTGPKSDQNEVFRNLKSTYQDRVDFVQVRVGQNPGGKELTFRSRSLLFLGIGIFVANNIGNEVPLLIPENGVIALNVPLTPSRRGSCSTRTAHPYYLQALQGILQHLGMNNVISNPLKYYTKGEALLNCKNQPLIKEISMLTVSCGKRKHNRNWTNRNAKHCGVCIPCIYRRASLHKLEMDQEIYGLDFCSNNFNIESELQTPGDIRAYLSFIKKDYTEEQIAKLLISNGKIAVQELNGYAHLIKRSMDEVRQLIRDEGSTRLQRLAGLISEG